MGSVCIDPGLPVSYLGNRNPLDVRLKSGLSTKLNTPKLVELNHVLAHRPVPCRAHINNHTGVIAVRGKCLNSISNLKQCQLLFQGESPANIYIIP